MRIAPQEASAKVGGLGLIPRSTPASDIIYIEHDRIRPA